MNTQAHAILSLYCLGRKESKPIFGWVLLLGAIMPDLPMFVFYAYQKAIGTPEDIIWGQNYFQPAWQNFFDIFNSIPLIMLGALIALVIKKPALLAFFSSMFLHCLGDLPLHHDDGHRHFWPLSHWRFESPFSYWDPNHHGQWISLLELLLSITLGVLLWKAAPNRTVKWMAIVMLGLYFIYGAYVLLVWV